MMRQKAIIIDLDGTLANSSHRHHFLSGSKGTKSASAWRLETDKDIPNQWCIDIISGLRKEDYAIIYLTGRGDECKESTREWLNRYVPGSNHEVLLMRPAKDNRPDYVIKTEIYMRDILPNYKVVMAIDDRPGVAKMWRNLGIVCLHCDSWEEDLEIAKKVHDTFEEEISVKKEKSNA